MFTNTLYTDLSNYYDLMCVDIDYKAQSNAVRRLHQIFGGNTNTHLDLACGTGPHIRHFIDFGYTCTGIDINQPMLDRAEARCPEAQFSLQNMSEFTVNDPFDLVTCFLYSIHYNDGTEKLKRCITSVHHALKTGGTFCFNAVDKHKINNNLVVEHTATHANSNFTFRSSWYYSGKGNKQSLKLSIEKTSADKTQIWNDEHSMVAVSFDELIILLQPYFDVHVFEHDYEKIISCGDRIKDIGNAFFVCVKI